MRLLVLTSVFGGYDRIFSPAVVDPGVDYIAITDDPSLAVSGWRSHVVDASQFPSQRMANRYYKMLGHRLFPGYDASLYVDGNIRVRRSVSRITQVFLESGKALGVFSHPSRSSVEAEVEACVFAGKNRDSVAARQELAAYVADGFPDDEGLMEAGVLLKRHGHSRLDAAMDLWWSLFERYQNRDQFSLPYVLWKTKLPCCRFEGSFRDPASSFGVYPHAGAASVSPYYVYFAARAYDSHWHRWVLALWHGKWKVQRRLRKLRGESQ